MSSPLKSRSRYIYAVIVVVVVISLPIFIWKGSVGEKEVAASFLAMVGTFLGALFAFRLNENKENMKVEEERKATLNRALFVVARQINALKSLSKHLAPFHTEFERAFNLPAVRPPSYSALVHDFQDLDFLLEVGHPNVFMRLSVEQEGFHQTLESLRVHNDFYVDEVQPVIAKNSFNRKPVPAQEFEAALGERLFGTAINSANILYSLVAESAQSLPTMHTELFGVAKMLYPDEKFIKLAPEA